MADGAVEDGAITVEAPIVNSIPSGEQTVWADVSPLFQAACLDLRDGELVCGENFNLFAAMSALEIMDPKMDSGIVCKYYSVDEAIEQGAAPVPLSSDKTTDIQCIINIMDHLLACEATWHKGQSLAQTVFSCIYLLRPDITSTHALLHSYCSIIRATCKAVISVVSDSRTHEEEDIFIMTYGLPLNGVRDERCLSLLNAVEETISRQLRACKAPSLKKRVVEENIEQLQSNPDLEKGYCESLLSRLRFRKHFYHILTSMRRPQGIGMELARKHIALCLQELKSIQKSSVFLRSSVGKNQEHSNEYKTTASGGQPIGFDATLNSRSSAPTPPRAISTLCWEKAIEYFEKLLHDLDTICSYSLDPSLEEVLNFIVQFQKSEPDLVARAHLQVLLVHDGKLYGRDPTFSVISRAAGLPDSAKNHNIQKNEYVIHLGQLVINLLKVLCTNASWQRRKLGKIVQDWRVIYVQLELEFQKELGRVSGIAGDEDLCRELAIHILNWTEEQTYWIAIRFLKLGFELELYSQSEFCMVYWYMYAVLIKLAEKTLLKPVANTNNVKRKPKNKRDSTKEIARDNKIPPSVLFLQCCMFLAEGLTMMIAALRNEQKISQCHSPFNTEQERFIQHFELLQKANVPDHISYHSFVKSTSEIRLSKLGMHNYFKEAQLIAKELKGSFVNKPEKMAEIRRLEQVAEHNSVALNIICRLGSLDSSLKVYFEFTHHPHFATAVVKRS